MDTDDKRIADLLTLTAFLVEGGVFESLLKAYCDDAEMFESRSGSPESSKVVQILKNLTEYSELVTKIGIQFLVHSRSNKGNSIRIH